MNPLAQQLNATIERENGHVFAMLSTLGKAIYFPKEGILSQSAEAKAKAKKYNATIGIAIENGQPMHLKVIQDTLSAYNPKDLYEYAPPAGKPELRTAWRDKMLKENPSLAGKIVRQSDRNQCVDPWTQHRSGPVRGCRRRCHHSGQKLGKLRADLRRSPRGRDRRISAVQRARTFNSRRLARSTARSEEQRQSDRRPELPE